MRAIDGLIQQLKTASGEELYRAILELGNQGEGARDAVEPLLKVARYHEDREARGRATLAVGLIDPDNFVCADVYAAIAEQVEADREFARSLDSESAQGFVAASLEAPLGALFEERNDSPSRPRGIKVEEIAPQHPCVIPYLVNALTTENALTDSLPGILGEVGRVHAEVSRLLVPLLDHKSVAVRAVAFYAYALTERMPVEELPRLILALQEEEERSRLIVALPEEDEPDEEEDEPGEQKDTPGEQLQRALRTMAELHPRDVLAALVDTLGAHGLYLFDPALLSLTFAVELTPLLGSPGAQTRKAAAFSLGEMGASASQSLPRLRELLDDVHLEVRAMAGQAVIKIEREARHLGML